MRSEGLKVKVLRNSKISLLESENETPRSGPRKKTKKLRACGGSEKPEKRGFQEGKCGIYF